jgi:receptor expression-enhancing protein 5/6
VPVVNDGVTFLASKVNAKKEHVAVLLVSLPVVLMFLFGGGHFVIDLVAYMYPAYASVKAIESNTKDDDTQWLTYWLVFSLFKLVEGIAEPLIHLIPFYFVGKVAFLVWCFYPGYEGAKVVYSNFIKPHVVPLLSMVDDKKAN